MHMIKCLLAPPVLALVLVLGISGVSRAGDDPAAKVKDGSERAWDKTKDVAEDVADKAKDVVEDVKDRFAGDDDEGGDGEG